MLSTSVRAVILLLIALALCNTRAHARALSYGDVIRRADPTSMSEAPASSNSSPKESQTSASSSPTTTESSPPATTSSSSSSSTDTLTDTTTTTDTSTDTATATVTALTSTITGTATDTSTMNSTVVANSTISSFLTSTGNSTMTMTGNVTATGTGTGTLSMTDSMNMTMTASVSTSSTAAYTPFFTKVTQSYTPTFVPAPSATQNVQNTTVSPTDPRIQTSGGGWETSQSSCDSQSTSQTTTMAGQNLNFTFQGTAVYMSTLKSSLAGLFAVAVDDQPPVEVDNFTNDTNPSCSVSWSAAGLLPGPHNVIVTTMGQSSNSAPDGQSASGSTFQLEGFTVTSALAKNSASRGISKSLAKYQILTSACVLSLTILFS